MVEFVISKVMLENLFQIFSILSSNVTIQFRKEKAVFTSSESDIFIKVVLDPRSSLRKYKPDNYITYFTIDPKYWTNVIRLFGNDIFISIPSSGSYAVLNDLEGLSKELRVFGYSDHNEHSLSVISETILLKNNAHQLADLIIKSAKMDSPSFLDLKWQNMALTLTITDRRNSIITSVIEAESSTSEDKHLRYHLERLTRAFQYAAEHDYVIKLAEDSVLHLNITFSEENSESCDILFSRYYTE